MKAYQKLAIASGIASLSSLAAGYLSDHSNAGSNTHTWLYIHFVSGSVISGGLFLGAFFMFILMEIPP